MSLMAPHGGVGRRDPAPAMKRREVDSYRTLLVYAGWSPTAQSLVKCASTLANRFGARLRGVGAPALVQAPAAREFDPQWATLDACGAYNMGLIGRRFEELTSLVANGASWTWRRAPPAEALALEAHAADLVIVNPNYTWPSKTVVFPGFAPTLRLGRPVLVVPWECDRLDARVVLVCWNESPECRRAMADAMPFLVRAEQVILQRFCSRGACGDDLKRLGEIERALRARGVNATCRATPWEGRRTATLIRHAAEQSGADLIVAGAYGHGGLYRALLGSTTEELLRTCSIAVFMSR